MVFFVITRNFNEFIFNYKINTVLAHEFQTITRQLEYLSIKLTNYQLLMELEKVINNTYMMIVLIIMMCSNFDKINSSVFINVCSLNCIFRFYVINILIIFIECSKVDSRRFITKFVLLDGSF